MSISARITLLGFAIVLTTGCAKKKECTTLTQAIREQRKSYGAGEASSAADFKKMAESYKSASDAIGGLNLEDPTLKQEQRDYTSLLDDLENAASMTAKVKSPEDYPESDRYAGIAVSAKKAVAKLGGRSEKEMYFDILKNCAE